MGAALVIESIALVLVLLAFGQYMDWWDLPVYRSFIGSRLGVVGSWYSPDNGKVIVKQDGTGTWTNQRGQTVSFHFDKKTGQMQIDNSNPPLLFLMWTTDNYQTLIIKGTDQNPVTTSKQKFSKMVE